MIDLYYSITQYQQKDSGRADLGRLHE